MLLLLYADDLTIMSTTPAGLQRQFNALQLFCEQQQLSVNLANSKVVTFSSRARCPAFTFNGNKVERVQSYKRLGFEFRATKKLRPMAVRAAPQSLMAMMLTRCPVNVGPRRLQACLCCQQSNALHES